MSAATSKPERQRRRWQRVADLRPTSCGRCRGPLSATNKSGVCLLCKRAAKAAKAAAGCLDCGRSKGFRAKRCDPCSRRFLKTDPRAKALRGAKISRRRRDRLASDPDFAAQLSRHAHALGKASRGSRRKLRPETIARRTATRLAWCPEEYRGLYRELRKGAGAGEARRLVEEQIRADRARMTPFDRQMAAVKAGAAVRPKMDLRPATIDPASGSSLVQFEAVW